MKRIYTILFTLLMACSAWAQTGRTSYAGSATGTHIVLGKLKVNQPGYGMRESFAVDSTIIAPRTWVQSQLATKPNSNSISAGRVPYASTLNTLDNSSIRADGTRAAIGGATDGSYLLRTYGTGRFDGLLTPNAGIFMPNDITIQLSTGFRMRGSNATGEIAFIADVGGFYPSWFFGATEWMKFRSHTDALHHLLELKNGGTIKLDSTLALPSPAIDGTFKYFGGHLYFAARGTYSQIDNQTTQSTGIVNTVVNSSAGTLALTATQGTVNYFFTGSTSTWTAPPIAGNTGGKHIIMNMGSGNITLNSNIGSADFYNKSSGTSVSSFTIIPNTSLTICNNGTYYVQQN